MAATRSTGKHPYHHGDLSNALVQAGVELARVGGPDAIVLREAARRVGVSQTAAYRHFDSLPDLANAVAAVAQRALAASMQTELAKLAPTGDLERDALANLRAVGRGYVYFALKEPGLFAAAFIAPKEHSGRPDTDTGIDTDTEIEAELSPSDLLERALDGLIAAGLLDAANRAAAAATAWSAVHGLSSLLLGPMSAVPAEELPAFIDSCLELIAFGLLTRK